MTTASPALSTAATPNLRLEIHREVPDDARIRVAWNELVLNLELGEVFYTWEWARAVADSFPTQVRPLVILAFHGDHLVAVAPLAVLASNPEQACFLGEFTSDYCDFVCRPELSNQFAMSVLSVLLEMKITTVELHHLRRNSPTYVALMAKHPGWFVTSRPSGSRCEQIVLGDQASRDALRKSLQQKNDIKQHTKKLEKLGKLQLQHAITTAEALREVPEFVSAHVSRFLVTDRVSPLVSSERRMFLRNLAEHLAPNGWLRFTVLKLDDKPIAWNFGFLFRGKWFHYQPTLSTEYVQHGPGSVMLKLLLDEILDDPNISVFDFGFGGESYKSRFVNAADDTNTLTLTTSPAQYVRTAIRTAAVSRLESRPRLNSTVRDARSRLKATLKRAKKAGWRFPLLAATSLFRKAYEKRTQRFYCWPYEARPDAASAVDSQPGLELRPIDWALVSKVNIELCEDQDSIPYLQRFAQRLHKGNAKGFALYDSGNPVSFLWMENLNGFYCSELSSKLDGFSESAVAIFDCWTPAKYRGRRFYGSAIRRAADLCTLDGREAWIFCDEENIASARGIEAAGFKFQFSMTATRFGRRVTLLRK